MRRVTRSVERDADGSWIITRNHLDKVEEFEARQLRDRPVTVETLSTLLLDKLPGAEVATWLDRELVADSPAPPREAGFGREVRAAQAMRRQWLVAEGLAGNRAGEPSVAAICSHRSNAANRSTSEISYRMKLASPCPKLDRRSRYRAGWSAQSI